MIIPDTIAETESVARHYDELDEFYREVWGEHLHHGYWVDGTESPAQAIEQLIHTVATRGGIRAGERVCDVGCGYGGTSRFLATEYHADVTGVTVSQAQFDYASSRTTPTSGPRFHLCPWEDNPFAAGDFDAVVSIECVSHVTDKAEFFRQIQRVVRPGGRAVVVAWLANVNAGRFATRHLLRPICLEGRLPSMATSDEYQAMIIEAGLRVESFEEISRQVRRTWWICVRRLLWKLATRLKYWRALLDRDQSNRVFALTLFRILTAYYTGSMQYGIFTIHRPNEADGGLPQLTETHCSAASTEETV